MTAAGPSTAAPSPPSESPARVHHRVLDVGGVDVFYREAGAPDAPAVLLLHGFGASSHMFRDLIPSLAADWHVLAPDLPGFGQTEVRDPGYRFTFDQLASTLEAFLDAKGLGRFAMYVFDYGAPVGWRLAVKHPDRIAAIVSQNGNAYEEGLSDGWAEIRAAWVDPTPEQRDALRRFSTPEMIRWQYVEGVRDPSLIAPETWQLASAAVERHGIEPQLDLILDYGNNIRQYALLHDYFRRHQPPTLVIWGARDPFFTPAGAEAFRRDNPNADVRLLDTGHFAIETHGPDIAAAMNGFLKRALRRDRARGSASTPWTGTDS